MGASVDDEDVSLSAWPEPGRDIRASSGVDAQHAFPGWWPGSAGRVRGFRRAAEILAAQMLAGNHTTMDTVVFPYLNCWRHYVELLLKKLLVSCSQLLDEPLDLKKHSHHRLDKLWASLGALLDKAFPSEDPVDRDVVGRVLTQLVELDPDNQEFRYSERRDGTPTMTGVEHLDIGHVHAAMLGLANYLEAVESAIDHHQDIKHEVLAEVWERRRELEQDMRDAFGV